MTCSYRLSSLFNWAFVCVLSRQCEDKQEEQEIVPVSPAWEGDAAAVGAASRCFMRTSGTVWEEKAY